MSSIFKSVSYHLIILVQSSSIVIISTYQIIFIIYSLIIFVTCIIIMLCICAITQLLPTLYEFNIQVSSSIMSYHTSILNIIISAYSIIIISYSSCWTLVIWSYYIEWSGRHLIIISSSKYIIIKLYRPMSRHTTWQTQPYPKYKILKYKYKLLNTKYILLKSCHHKVLCSGVPRDRLSPFLLLSQADWHHECPKAAELLGGHQPWTGQYRYIYLLIYVICL